MASIVVAFVFVPMVGWPFFDMLVLPRVVKWNFEHKGFRDEELQDTVDGDDAFTHMEVNLFGGLPTLLPPPELSQAFFPLFTIP